jgi:hypothetical protein
MDIHDLYSCWIGELYCQDGRKASKFKKSVTTSSGISVSKATVYLGVNHKEKSIEPVIDQGSSNTNHRVRISSFKDFMYVKIIIEWKADLNM